MRYKNPRFTYLLTSKNPSKGFGLGAASVRPRKTAFPIDFVHRPYNSVGVGTTVPHCDSNYAIY